MHAFKSATTRDIAWFPVDQGIDMPTEGYYQVERLFGALLLRLVALGNAIIVVGISRQLEPVRLVASHLFVCFSMSALLMCFWWRDVVLRVCDASRFQRGS
jgi:hypothetical protein